MKPRHFLLIVMLMLEASSFAGIKKWVSVDSMVDFRYPSSTLENLITHVTEILYKLEVKKYHADGVRMNADDFDAHIQSLDQLRGVTEGRHNVSPEDVAFLQNMIDRIDSLINHLEQDDSSKAATMHELCGKIKRNLS